MTAEGLLCVAKYDKFLDKIKQKLNKWEWMKQGITVKELKGTFEVCLSIIICVCHFHLCATSMQAS